MAGQLPASRGRHCAARSDRPDGRSPRAAPPVQLVDAPPRPVRRRRSPPPPLELALPRDFEAAYGTGVDRGLCLGGGGLFFVAWQVGYLHTLANHGVRFDNADRVVGTSAGSMVASALTSGKLKRLHAEVSLLAKVPALVSALAPASTLEPSQQRALDLFIKATDGEPVTVQEIGHAALAAATPRPEVMRRNIALVVGPGPWTVRRPPDHLRRRLHRRAVRGDRGSRHEPATGGGGQQRRARGSSPPSPSATGGAWTAG